MPMKTVPFSPYFFLLHFLNALYSRNTIKILVICSNCIFYFNKKDKHCFQCLPWYYFGCGFHCKPNRGLAIAARMVWTYPQYAVPGFVCDNSILATVIRKAWLYRA